MIVVIIIGVLASIAIPGFKHYRDKAKFAESYQSMAALTAGAKAYYQQEHWAQGVVTTVGYVGESTYCNVASAWTSNSWNMEKTMMNWDNEPQSFRDLSFNPSDPILFRYYAGHTTSAGYGCGHQPGTQSVFLFGAYLDFKQGTGGFHGQQWRLCSNADNNLFVCERTDSPVVDYN